MKMSKRNKLTILKILYARPSIGGSGRLGIDLGIEMAKRGHKVHIISYPGTYLSDEELKYLNFHQIPQIDYNCFKSSPSNLIFPSKILEIAEKENIDIIHAHYAITHGEAAVESRDLIKKHMKKKLLPYQEKTPVALITCHGTDISINGYKKEIGPALSMKLDEADRITFVSKSLQNMAKETLNLKNYGQVIYNFIDEDKFVVDEFQEFRQKFREYFSIRNSELVFYHVSNFRPVKNTELIVDAVYNLVLKDISNFKVVFIGDGPDKDKVESKITSLGISNMFRFVGEIEPESIPEYSQIGDVMILPSKKESFGLVNLEAMNLCKPVIGSNIGGIPEVIQHGVSGYLFDSENSNQLSSYMLKFIQNPSLANMMGRNAKLHANKFFSKEKIVSDYERLYFELLNKKNKKGVIKSMGQFTPYSLLSSRKPDFGRGEFNE